MNETANNGETPFLPEEIVINILKRLPVKSLLRFQCICKQWKNLFKTPSFIHDHLLHSTHHNSSLVIGSNNHANGFYLLSFNWEFKFRKFENAPLIGSSRLRLCLVGSSNGILCFTDWSKKPASPLLWNPATREVRQVPIISDHFSGSGFGFGFSPIINDYKIVRFPLFPMVGKVEVYSLSTGCWRNIQFDDIKDVCRSGGVVTANGVMFWSGISFASHGHVIVSFDLATEVYTVIPWPAFVSFSGTLTVYDDKLAIISYRDTRNTPYSPICFEEGYVTDYSSICFMVMEEGAIGSSGERWSSSLKCTGNTDVPLYDGTIWRNHIVCAHCRPPTIRKRLYLSNVITNECELVDIPKVNSASGICIFNYVESLVPLSSNIEIEEP